MTSSSSPANGLDPRQGERHRTTGGAVRLSAHARVRPLRDHPTPEPFTPRRHTSGSLQPAGLRSRRGGARPVQLRWILEAIGRLPMLVHPMATPRPAQRGAIGDGSFLHLPGGLIATIGPSGLVVSRVGRGVAIPDTTTREGLARLARDGRRLRALLATRTGGRSASNSRTTIVLRSCSTRRPSCPRWGIDLLPSRDQAAAPPTSPPEPADQAFETSMKRRSARSPQAPRRDGTTHPRPSPRMTRPTASRSGTRGSASARSGPTGPSRSWTDRTRSGSSGPSGLAIAGTRVVRGPDVRPVP